MITHTVLRQPDKSVYLFHQTFGRGSTREEIVHACYHFFEEYMTYPDYILMSALERVQLPFLEWETLQLHNSFPIKIRCMYDPDIPISPITLHYGYVLCIGRQFQYLVQTHVILQDTPLSITDILFSNPFADLATFLLTAFK